MIPQVNGIQNKVNLAILKSNKINFKTKKVMRWRWIFYNEKEDNPFRHNICVIHTHTYTYILNLGAAKYIKQLLLDQEREIENRIRVGDLNIPPTPIDRSSKQSQ